VEERTLTRAVTCFAINDKAWTIESFKAGGGRGGGGVSELKEEGCWV
jgi:hypothetical protein